CALPIWMGHFKEKIISPFPIVINIQNDTIIQQPEIETDVKLFCCFPSKIRVSKTARSKSDHRIAVETVPYVFKRCKRPVCTDFSVTRQTIAHSEFQVADCAT